MGWTFQEKPADVGGYLRSLLTWETEKKANKCLDLAMKLNVAYAAVETIDKATGAREVWAAIFLMKYIRGDDPYNWGYKDLVESCGPVESSCPERILNLLTPTENDWANEWRERCRENLRKRMPKVGVKVRFEHPVQFTDGSEESVFLVVRLGRRRKGLQGPTGRLFRVSQRMWRDREWAIVQ